MGRTESVCKGRSARDDLEGTPRVTGPYSPGSAPQSKVPPPMQADSVHVHHSALACAWRLRGGCSPLGGRGETCCLQPAPSSDASCPPPFPMSGTLGGRPVSRCRPKRGDWPTRQRWPWTVVAPGRWRWRSQSPPRAGPLQHLGRQQHLDPPIPLGPRAAVEEAEPAPSGRPCLCSVWPRRT